MSSGDGKKAAATLRNLSEIARDAAQHSSAGTHVAAPGVGGVTTVQVAPVPKTAQPDSGGEGQARQGLPAGLLEEAQRIFDGYVANVTQIGHDYIGP